MQVRSPRERDSKSLRSGLTNDMVGISGELLGRRGKWIWVQTPFSDAKPFCVGPLVSARKKKDVTWLVRKAGGNAQNIIVRVNGPLAVQWNI